MFVAQKYLEIKQTNFSLITSTTFMISTLIFIIPFLILNNIGLKK